MSKDIKVATEGIIRNLHKREGNDKAILAAARNSNSILSKQATKVWPIIFSQLDEKDLADKSVPTYAEIAVFATLRCYALFEQGNDDVRDREYDPAHSVSLFRALAALRSDDRIKDGLDRRVKNLLSTTNLESVTKSLASLVKILKSNNSKVELDYGSLANDLKNFQYSFESARKVSIKWGRDYFWISDQTLEKLANEEEK